MGAVYKNRGGGVVTWLPAPKASVRLSALIGREAARYLLVERAQTGAVRARARAFSHLGSRDSLVEIPRWFWKLGHAETGYREDLQHGCATIGEWLLGDFTLYSGSRVSGLIGHQPDDSTDGDGREVSCARGVEFNDDDIDSLARALSANFAKDTGEARPAEGKVRRGRAKGEGAIDDEAVLQIVRQAMADDPSLSVRGAVVANASRSLTESQLEALYKRIARKLKAQ